MSGQEEIGIDEEELLELFVDDGESSSKKRKRNDDKDKRTVPLKKRLQQKEPSPVASGSVESESSDDGMDEDLFMGEKDKERLLALPEAQREEILYERAEKRRDIRERKKLRKENRQTPKEQKQVTQQHRQPKRPTNTKTSALDDIKARRNLKTKGSSSKRRYNDDDEYEEEESNDDYSEENEEEGDDNAEFPNPPEVDEDYKYDETATEEHKPRSPEKIEEITFQDLLPVVIKRSKLEKWYEKPCWEKAVPRLFVRPIIGQDRTTGSKVYRIAEIIQLTEANNIYKLGKKECNQLVTLKIGDKTKNFEMKYLSNEPPTEEEFRVWLKWNQKLKEPLPTKSDIEKLKEQIIAADTYVYTEEDVDKQVKKNRENSAFPVNFTKERIRILDLINQEKVSGDYDKVSLLQSQLRELEEKEYEMLKKMESKMSMKNVNKRNANFDMQNAQKVKLQKLAKQASNLDPYARRSTNAAASWLKKKENKEDTSHFEKQGGEVKDEPEKKTGKSKTITKINIDINNINNTAQKNTSVPPNNKTGTLLKPITTSTLPAVTNNPQIKTLSLSDYKKKKAT